MTNDDLENLYFEWIFNKLCAHRYKKPFTFRKLLMQLHSIEFTWLIRRDHNRSEDGIELRRRFLLAEGYEECCFRTEPCSVLEMMTALAVRCEENIMDDPMYGDRTAQWFWGMVTNMGLGSMTDNNYDRLYVDSCVSRMLNREYDSDGRGGLFTIRDHNRDMRTAEIWYQLCWFLDSITDY